MKKEVRQIFELFKYQLYAKSIKSVHPPFAYELVKYIKSNQLQPDDKKTIFDIKRSAANNNNVIEHTDMGASAKGRGYTRVYKRISSIAERSSIRHKYGKLLYLLVKYFQPGKILELGTALGVSTLYLSLASDQKKTKIITIEGCTETAHVAEKYLQKANIHNTQVMIGGFENVLPHAINETENLDLVFFDGNHKYQPTLDYFNLCKQHITEDAIFVFDDIHWSKEMSHAWRTIKRDPDVTLSLDFFQLGVVFFKKGLSKQNLVIRY